MLCDYLGHRWGGRSRSRRATSDQRMAELQALIALSNGGGDMVGHGAIDPFSAYVLSLTTPYYDSPLPIFTHYSPLPIITFHSPLPIITLFNPCMAQIQAVKKCNGPKSNFLLQCQQYCGSAKVVNIERSKCLQTYVFYVDFIVKVLFGTMTQFTLQLYVNAGLCCHSLSGPYEINVCAILS